MNELINVGIFSKVYNDILGTSYDELVIYRSSGLISHMIKRGHYKALKYIDKIPEIISSPDYIGINPNEQGRTSEFVKKFEDNISLGIKLNDAGEYYYVSTMFDVSQNKIDRFVHSGRLKEFVDMDDEILYNNSADELCLDEPEKVPGAPVMEPDMVDDSPPTQD